MPEHIEFWHWWVLAALLMAVEVFAPTTLFLWTGISAGAVGLVVLVAEDIGWESQVLLFAVLSLVSVVAWRRYARLRPVHSEDPWLNRRAEQYIGRQFTLEEPIVNGEGTVKVDDTTWKIAGENLEAGSRVKVVGVDGVILKVEPA
jgi:membrane protein implicated in regulation of membrane protease activity